MRTNRRRILSLLGMSPVVAGQTNPYHAVASMRYAVSPSIDKWA